MWLHQKKALCLQVVYDPYKEAPSIELTHSEEPLDEDVVDTLCFQNEGQRDDWQYRIKEFSLCPKHGK